MNLLTLNNPEMVDKTNLSRKLTLGGVTKAYPVYRVRLDLLYFNDQNDRIATWITQYKNDPGKPDFTMLSEEEYNRVIQQFIIDSNPAAIEKTKNNIALVNQREPGVVLKDGRIIDGNRRFTCLRLLHETDPAFNYFETVILDDSGENSQKQIKMLELAIQHGEEQRVDYNSIDMAIGAYHDIIETKLLSIEEYAASTNETQSEVKKRLEIAQLITEFLNFMGVPGQYHIARDMQVFSVFSEMVPLMKRCETDEAKAALKSSVFSNTMMASFVDQRKYIRNVRSMMESGLFSSYIKRQQRICEELEERKEDFEIKNEEDLKSFIRENEELREDLQISMERSLTQAKKAQTKSRPSQLVSKSISTLMDIDTRIIDKLSETEKEKLSGQLKRLSDAVSLISTEIDPENTPDISEPQSEKTPTRLFAATHPENEPYVFCEKPKITITNLSFTLPFTAEFQISEETDTAEYVAYFVNDDYESLSPVQRFQVRVGETTKTSFTLNPSASSLDRCFLILRSVKDAADEAQSIIRCQIKIAFQVEVDF